MSPVGKVYVVRAVFQNVNTCLYGNITSATFDMEPGNIRDYFQQKKKKKLYKEYFYIEKIDIPLHISCFFCTLFKI